MERTLGRCALIACPLSLALLAGAVRAAGDDRYAPPPSGRSADALVAAALEAEAAGDADARARLLAEAIAVDGDHAPARWLNGELKFEGKWRDLIEVGAVVNHDRRWREYAKLKESTANTVDGHAELARWCMRNGLENEERFHWANVLAANPRYEFAQARLGLEEREGGLFTKQQIAEQEQRRVDAERALARYTPKFEEICATIATAESTERTAALDELARVDDVAALPALEQVIQRHAEDASDELALELSKAFVRAAANVPEHEATLKLMNLSVFAPQPEVRWLAARSLKPRAVTDYVPLLMASLAAPIEFRIKAFTSRDGTVSYRERLFQAGPEADLLVKREVDRLVMAGRGAPPTAGQVARGVADNRTSAAAQATAARRRVEQANLEAEVRNERIREVFRNALDFDLGADPKAYWQEWQSYNELYYEEHPINVIDEYVSIQEPVSHSCFKAGTPVWTQHGLTPIEQIAAGDLVLAQHVDTGEIAFRPVVQKTLGPPIETVRIAVNHEAITATRGHRFWVNGQGWEMAKALKPSLHLHALDGAVEIREVAEGERLRCHNLVVDDFHTFFVGESRILVHDKSCPRPTTAMIPGGPAHGSDAVEVPERGFGLSQVAR
ncbi:MAG: hypothetical protein H0T51_07575 [Pirellulales bacterium]|nr:hypothetical protein [Pirellulales bacterium]